MSRQLRPPSRVSKTCPETAEDGVGDGRRGGVDLDRERLEMHGTSRSRSSTNCRTSLQSTVHSRASAADGTMTLVHAPAQPISERSDVGAKVVALTFDDGPAEWTTPILDTLSSYGVRATFFVIGEAISGRESILMREIAEGHEIGNHTRSHFGALDASCVSREQVEREIQGGRDDIAAVTGAAPRIFRPPGFGSGGYVPDVAGALGFNWLINASVTTADFNHERAEDISREIMEHERIGPGAIIDLHDGRPPHEAPEETRMDRWPTVAAVEEIVPLLLDHGYAFVTVSELLAL